MSGQDILGWSLEVLWAWAGIVEQGAGTICSIVLMVTVIRHVIILLDRVQVRDMEAAAHWIGLVGWD